MTHIYHFQIPVSIEIERYTFTNRMKFTVALRDRSVAHIDVLLENTLEGVQREAPNVNDVHLQALASRISVQQLQAAPNAAVSQPLSAQDVAQPQIVMQNAKQALQQQLSEISKPLPVGWTSHYDKE